MHAPHSFFFIPRPPQIRSLLVYFEADFPDDLVWALALMVYAKVGFNQLS